MLFYGCLEAVLGAGSEWDDILQVQLPAGAKIPGVRCPLQFLVGAAHIGVGIHIKTGNTAGIIGYMIIHIKCVTVEGRMIVWDISGTFNCLGVEDGTAILFCSLCKLHIIGICCSGSSQDPGGRERRISNVIGKNGNAPIKHGAV